VIERADSAFRLDRREFAGAVADVGVLVPITVALIVVNGLSPTAALLPAGVLYLVAGLVYRLPVPVQPLKAFGAIAIAKGLGTDEIAAGALLVGVIFLCLGSSGLLDRVARSFPKPLIRGVQLTVGLLFLKIAWGLVTDPPRAFSAFAIDPGWAVPLAAAALALALAFKNRPVTLALVGSGVAVLIAQTGADVRFGPSPIDVPSLDIGTFGTAFVVLVLPQLPLTFANSCLATADAARSYFGSRARRIKPGRLAITLGTANVFSGILAGMPVCHGAGGLTAHRVFGARTAGAPVIMGAALIVVAVLLGANLGTLLAGFPLPILAALLAAAGVLHIGLLGDLEGGWNWGLAIAVGLIGFELNLAAALAFGLAAWWLPVAALRLRAASAAEG
jgi:sulfate permease, SulP family